MEFDVTHRGDWFYIRTNDQAEDFRLLRAPVDSPSLETCEEVWPHRPGEVLEAVTAFSEHLVAIVRREGLKRLRLVHLPTGRVDEVDFDEPAWSLGLGTNLEFETSILRFSHETPSTPASIYDLDMHTGDRVLRKRQPVLGDFDPARYEVLRLHAPARDGERIPITVVRRRGMRQQGGDPTVLYGYGSYGICIEPYFSTFRLSLLDRGVTWAIAHIRGSGTLGRRWWNHGKLAHKQNTFSDFADCAAFLVEAGHAAADRVAMIGGSAGGLLVGAVANQAPERFCAAVAHVPFVDVINTMLDATLPLTVIEWEEWGNPAQPDDYATMCAYAPYENIAAQDYPHLLVISGLNDPRVAFWEPTKWVARLRHRKTDDHELLLKTHMGAGHGGVSGRYARIREVAFEYAWVLDKLGVPAG